MERHCGTCAHFGNLAHSRTTCVACVNSKDEHPHWEAPRPGAIYEVSNEAKAVQTANDIQIAGDHYKGKTIQPWDYIASNKLGYFEGNVVKYVSRWRDKGGVADLEKARHYLDKLIELERCAKP